MLYVCANSNAIRQQKGIILPNSLCQRVNIVSQKSNKLIRVKLQLERDYKGDVSSVTPSTIIIIISLLLLLSLLISLLIDTIKH